MKNKMSLNTVSLTLSLLFCVGSLFVLTALFFVPDKSFSKTEKRVLALFPKVTFSSVADGSFSEDVEKYIQDQIPFRNFFVGFGAYTQLFLGQNGTDGVYKCDDGYLINTPIKYNERNLSGNLQKLNGFVKDFDGEKYILAVPQTGYIMDEKLPSRHGEYADGEIFSAVKRQTDESFGFVDITEAFKENKNAVQLYYKTDHHWTMNGAFIAMNEFLKTAGRATVDKTAFTVEKHGGFFGTTHSSSALWLNPSDTLEIWHCNGADVSVTVRDIGKDTEITSNSVYFKEHLNEYDMYPVYLGGNHSFTHIVNENAPDGVLLLLKDSFGNSLASLLSSSYREIIMVDLRYYRTEAVSELIEEYGVDTVLVNYGLDNLVNDTNFIWLR